MVVRSLILFSRSFPNSGSELPFLQNEIKFLGRKFKSVTVVPAFQEEGKPLELPDNINVDYSLCEKLKDYHRKKNLFVVKSLFSSLFYKEFRKIGSSLSTRAILQLVFYIARTLYVQQWLKMHVLTASEGYHKTVLYTFWLNYITTALTREYGSNNNCILISRAHGGDLYLERHKGYIPMREFTFTGIDRVFFASLHGMGYAQRNYPEFIDKFELSALGVPGPVKVSNPIPGKGFNVVSCSSIVSLKRVDLLFCGVLAFAEKNPNLEIKWIHFGGGELFGELERSVIENTLKNLSCKLMGPVTNQEILSFYQNSDIDVFISTSKTEGGRPVSMQEAQSFGIPIIGTSVGGIPEVVNEQNGILLSADPSSIEIANALSWFIRDPNKTLEKRIQSRASWEEKFNSEKIYNEFAQRLLELG